MDAHRVQAALHELVDALTVPGQRIPDIDIWYHGSQAEVIAPEIRKLAKALHLRVEENMDYREQECFHTRAEVRILGSHVEIMGGSHYAEPINE
ncbi:hypothetical protein D1872_181480 [compost metagenome]